MKRNFDNKITDIKKAEEERRAEITMMYVYMDRYPEKAREKLRKHSINEVAVREHLIEKYPGEAKEKVRTMPVGQSGSLL